ncbi:diguanylate cyclase (GGDEF)-like protein [Neobacillus niacini]|uniref:bifunctional diguanylate cyclase/phosphodiesterase n=1 Tax=Neobacillus niacini TaxID=86668 RepID=UPI00277F0113|nr:EAL domain-containing protein [Neobacillus niacini]MDQ1000474.1 diguanylate cyclase (GGDEF)-like protein [Neobacillus niacini]
MSIKSKLSIIFSSVVSIILIVSSALNYFFTKDLLENDQKHQMDLLANEVKISIEQADIGSKYIEDLIGEKLRYAAIYAKSNLDPKLENISNEELVELSQQLGVSHITLFQQVGDDIVGKKSSDPTQIELSTKEWGYWFEAFQQLLNNQQVTIKEGQKLPNYWAGPFDVSTSDPGSIDKWGYYYDGTTDYIINPYIKDDQLYQKFIETTSSSSIVNKILAESNMILDITGFNPKTFGKEAIYTNQNGERFIELRNRPLFFGKNSFESLEKDIESVVKAYETGKSVSYVATINGKKVIKNFVPIQAENPYVTGLVTDYNVIQNILNKQLINNMVISILLLFMVFFGSYFLAGYIVRPLNKILRCVDEISDGNFGVRIALNRKDELGVLAERVNTMSDSLASYTKQLKDKNEEIKYLAYYDALTQLPNRNGLHELFNLKIEESKRDNKKLATLFLDLDRFKPVNDLFGHTIGDQLLKEVAKRLDGHFESNDSVTRFGGDEFILVLFDTDYSQTVKAVERIIEILGQPFTLEGNEIFITPSIGISMYPQDGTDIESLIKSADIALYRAKEKGKNTYEFFTSDMKTAALKRAQLEKDLHYALQRGELELYYQPQVSLKSGKVIGMEALLRWNHPELGSISPDEFIPLAEESNLIIPIGEWVIREACIQNKKWQETIMPNMRVSVNLSAIQFHQHLLVKVIEQILQEIDLDPQFLEIEITESIAMYNADYVISKLKDLKQIGVKISIDDFGTGYSSLSYLKEFTIDTLKIDRSFINDLDNSGIISTIITMAKYLNLNVIAEGVETVDQILFLKQHLCDEVQGYYFSKPLPAREIEELYSSLNEVAASFTLD